MIEFDSYVGPRFFNELNDPRINWIPINPLNAYSKYYNTNRIQLPLRLAYALTIHKSQGLTLIKAVIELGVSEKSLGLMYVTLSRLKCFHDFLIQPFTLERLQKLCKLTSLKPRQNEELRIKKKIKKTLDDHFQRLMN